MAPVADTALNHPSLTHLTYIQTKIRISLEQTCLCKRLCILFKALQFCCRLGQALRNIPGPRRKECEQHEQTWQPQVLVLGTDAAHIEQIFLLVDNTSYIMTSVLKAIDVCFKLTFVTNLSHRHFVTSTRRNLGKS